MFRRNFVKLLFCTVLGSFLIKDQKDLKVRDGWILRAEDK